jgi:thiol-disulfide isomerase/thioredoxin
MPDDYVKAQNKKRLRSTLIVLGVVLFVILVAVFKNLAAERKWLFSEPAAPQLEEYRAAGQPVLVFFHSPDCSSCNQVQQSIDEVYPEFKNTVALLDLDVTDKRERDLVERTGVQTTPTLLLVDDSGVEKLIVGEISPADLRAELNTLVGGTP